MEDWPRHLADHAEAHFYAVIRLKFTFGYRISDVARFKRGSFKFRGKTCGPRVEAHGSKPKRLMVRKNVKGAVHRIPIPAVEGMQSLPAAEGGVRTKMGTHTFPPRSRPNADPFPAMTESYGEALLSWGGLATVRPMGTRHGPGFSARTASLGAPAVKRSQWNIPKQPIHRI